jgi:hypothetical protein
MHGGIRIWACGLVLLLWGCSQVVVVPESRTESASADYAGLEGEAPAAKISALVNRMRSESYSEREAAERELRSLFPEDMEQLDRFLTTLKEAVAREEDPEAKTRIERILGPYSRIQAFCQESKLVVVAYRSGMGHWDSYDGAGNFVGYGYNISFSVGVTLKGKSEEDINLPKDETRIINGKESTRTFLVMPDSDVNRYVVFIRDREDIRRPGGFEILPATSNNIMTRYALFKLGAPSGEVFAEALKNDDLKARETAVWALGAMRPEELDLLIEAVKDEYWDVQFEALKALTAATGQDFGFDYDAWMEWYEKNRGR